ncbi:Rv1733c family protein [Actinomadura macra]|uniref:Rv1733c family protein n=1 Tax=Actinomadura macra TaxID=46164 RepID=UPI00082E72A6|nr:hypothetical protein [Actinomadura macra]
MNSAHPHHVGDGVDRLRRRFGFDLNDLRRSVDRRQWAVGLGAALVFAGIGPPACAAAVALAYQAGLRAEVSQSSAHHRISAQVARVERPAQGPASALLTWTTSDGRQHSATVAAGRSATWGAEQQVWVDASGEMTRRPQNRSDSVTGAVFAGVAAIGAAGVPPLGAYLLVRRRCDRRRQRMWDTAWARLDRHKSI